jgi:hypothetical protein
LREHDAQLAEIEKEAEDAAGILMGDATIEAVARTLSENGGAGAIDADELATLLGSLGEYKRGGGADRGRLLSLWAGAPWNVTRTGGGGSARNQVRLKIPRPTVAICGGLQTARHELLGDEESGLRPRWLPHIGAVAETGSLSRARAPVAWQSTLAGALIPQREQRRIWRLDDHGLAAFEHHRAAWRARAGAISETASASAALEKADRHLARLALIFAEADAPGQAGTIGAEIVERAAAVIAYTLDCWRALPEFGGLALSYRDEKLDAALPRLVSWLESHGGHAKRRELQRARVAGVRTARDLDSLLARYEATYPGTVEDAAPEHGGRASLIVRSPARTSMSPPLTKESVWGQSPANTGNQSGDNAKTGDNVETSRTPRTSDVSKSGDNDTGDNASNHKQTPTDTTQPTNTPPGDNDTGDNGKVLDQGYAETLIREGTEGKR